MEDIRGLMPLAQDGVVGVIVGRALYEGKIDLAEAIRAAKTEHL
jgi:phosphoribosylformimino-5-aminoimidazole carboxamide ribotide isomerase